MIKAIKELDQMGQDERHKYWNSLTRVEKQLLYSMIQKDFDRKRLKRKIEQALPFIILFILMQIIIFWFFKSAKLTLNLAGNQ